MAGRSGAGRRRRRRRRRKEWGGRRRWALAPKRAWFA
jgi:hypothetical protein